MILTKTERAIYKIVLKMPFLGKRLKTILNDLRREWNLQGSNYKTYYNSQD